MQWMYAWPNHKGGVGRMRMNSTAWKLFAHACCAALGAFVFGLCLVRTIKHLQAIAARSPPSRGRGSKQNHLFNWGSLSLVAPFTGAWIETAISPAALVRRLSPPSRGRGSKRPVHLAHCEPADGRLLYGDVDQNILKSFETPRWAGRLLHGGVQSNAHSRVNRSNSAALNWARRSRGFTGKLTPSPSNCALASRHRIGGVIASAICVWKKLCVPDN
jgi:hypothetical protein